MIEWALHSLAKLRATQETLFTAIARRCWYVTRGWDQSREPEPDSPPGSVLASCTACTFRSSFLSKLKESAGDIVSTSVVVTVASRSRSTKPTFCTQPKPSSKASGCSNEREGNRGSDNQAKQHNQACGTAISRSVREPWQHALTAAPRPLPSRPPSQAPPLLPRA